ncbi:MAG TPA: UDP-glucose 4-epimerase GalE [Thermodesulfobacteriota bacterium]|nr:UDP-glucose 4-epimerase GalE [Thermodesulfobacteriota bacterium]
MSTILVTGGAGYIGSHVVKELLHQNYKPIVFDNLQTGHRKAIKNALFIEGDLSDQEKLAEVFQANSVDAVMHFAADCLVGESVQDPLKYFNNNVKNGLKLIEIMEQFYVKQIVFSSSAAVYGEPEEIPISEGHPCAPTNPYGETKWIFEKVFQAFHDGDKLNFISLRYFNAAGADSDGELGEDHSRETHLIPLVIKAALDTTSVPIFGTDYETPDGTCIRDYIHVTDLANAHILALQKLDQGKISGTYNLGNGNGYSVRQVIETVRKVTGRNVATVDSPRRPGDPARLVASSQKIRHELGWIPRYPDLETIVKTAYDWHRKHPKGYDDEHSA